MPAPTPALLESEPDLAVLDKLARFEHVCLAAVMAIAAANLAVWSIPDLGHRFAATLSLMPPEAGLAALLSALSLRFSEPRESERLQRLSALFAVLVMVI